MSDSHQSHDHECHKHGFADKPGLQREDAQNHLNRAARVHRQADSDRGVPVHAAQSRPPSRTQNFPKACYADDEGSHRGVKVGHEIGVQTDAGEKQRGEDVRHDLANVFGGALTQMSGFANCRARDERSEHGVDACVFSKSGRGQSQRKDEAENPSRPRGMGLDERENPVNQRLPDVARPGPQRTFPELLLQNVQARRFG
jgi:hypothetical protein